MLGALRGLLRALVADKELLPEMPEPCSIFFCTRRSNKAGGGWQAGDMVGSRRPGNPKKTPVGFQGTSPCPVGSLLRLHSHSTTAPACSPCAKSAALSPSFIFPLLPKAEGKWHWGARWESGGAQPKRAAAGTHFPTFPGAARNPPSPGHLSAGSGI